MTSAPAHAAGVVGRGLLQVGKRADINVIDLASVGEGFVSPIHSFNDCGACGGSCRPATLPPSLPPSFPTVLSNYALQY